MLRTLENFSSSTKETSLLRHSRAGGNPVNRAQPLDSRLRGNDFNRSFFGFIAGA